MITPFEDLIQELGTTLGLSFHLDPHGACCLQMNEKLRVQIEPDKQEDRIILAAFIGELNPGRFREDVLKEALKANAQFIGNGNAGAILGFSARHNQLACHTFLPILEISPEKLLASLTYLTEHALSWMEALQSGRAAPPGIQTLHTAPTAFGKIRP